MTAIHLPAWAFPLALLSAASAFAAPAEQPHVHGVARVDVAVEARRITVQLDSPLDNLVGFEHVPRNDTERKLAAAAVAKLKAADAMFRIDPAAGCSLAKVELVSAALGLGQPDPAEAKSGHADLDGTAEFDCRDGAGAAWIDTALFGFAPLQRVEVQVAGPSSQFRRTLVRPAGRIVLTK